MTQGKIPNVGAQDPELKNSPVLEETDEDFDVIPQEAEELPVCYYNAISYPDGAYVCSGSGELLHCVRGVWVQSGSCDPDNP